MILVGSSNCSVKAHINPFLGKKLVRNSNPSLLCVPHCGDPGALPFLLMASGSCWLRWRCGHPHIDWCWWGVSQQEFLWIRLKHLFIPGQEGTPQCLLLPCPGIYGEGRSTPQLLNRQAEYYSPGSAWGLLHCQYHWAAKRKQMLITYSLSASIHSTRSLTGRAGCETSEKVNIQQMFLHVPPTALTAQRAGASALYCYRGQQC